MAQKKGVSFIARDWSELQNVVDKFDVITAFDVIEHIPTPYDFMKTLMSNLKPGGYLIISSGNSTSLPALLEGPRHYYCVNPEHLSFVSPKWFRKINIILGLKIKNISQQFPEGF